MAWSREEVVVAGWLQTAWAIEYRGIFGREVAGGLTNNPFVLDLERRQITFFRPSKLRLPMFLIEEPEVVKALRERSVPWR